MSSPEEPDDFFIVPPVLVLQYLRDAEHRGDFPGFLRAREEIPLAD